MLAHLLITKQTNKHYKLIQNWKFITACTMINKALYVRFEVFMAVIMITAIFRVLYDTPPLYSSNYIACNFTSFTLPLLHSQDEHSKPYQIF
jgi:hypothetical protein